jgi:hypothetical protein
MILKTSLQWVIALIVILTPNLANAQEKSANNKGDQGDRNVDFHMFHGRPTISLYYGLSDNSLDNLQGPLANSRLLEVRLGSTSKELADKQANILKYKYGYISLAKISSDLGETSSEGEIETDIWRINVGWEDGYGYELNKSNIVTYSSFAFGWSRLRVESSVQNKSDREVLSLFDDAFRFGTKMEGGIKLQFVPMVTADLGYERAIVYRRFLFWKALTSLALEGLGQWMLDEFIDEIMESSPRAVPVVSFLLKNGFSYGAYELRKEKMNYPFDTAPPFLTDSFKIGVSFVF